MKTYYIKKDKVDEIKDGRTFTNIANILDVTSRHIYSILAENNKCKKSTAMLLINLKSKTPINTPEMEELINYYFETKEE